MTRQRLLYYIFAWSVFFNMWFSEKYSDHDYAFVPRASNVLVALFFALIVFRDLTEQESTQTTFRDYGLGIIAVVSFSVAVAIFCKLVIARWLLGI